MKSISSELYTKYEIPKHFNKEYKQNFFEYTLEELGFPKAEELLDATLKIEKDIGGIRGWMKDHGESTVYKGFSLCYNKNSPDPYHQSSYASLGHPNLNHTFSRNTNPQNPWGENYKNTYYDSYGFTDIIPSVEVHYKSLLESVDLTLTRSRTMWHIPPFKQPWHKDEPLYSVMRINIPLQTENSYFLEIKGKDEYNNSLTMDKHLEVGKAYMWNTKIPHRMLDRGKGKKPRIHIVLGFIPWFQKVNNDFIKNKYFGVQPWDMLTSKIIFPKAI